MTALDHHKQTQGSSLRLGSKSHETGSISVPSQLFERLRGACTLICIEFTLQMVLKRAFLEGVPTNQVELVRLCLCIQHLKNCFFQLSPSPDIVVRSTISASK
jgi:hypothetical protein